jgi:hypothetical protein
MSLTGWAGGAVALPVTGVAGFLLAGVDDAVVVHRAVLHMIIRIKLIITLFKGITMISFVVRDTYVEEPLLSR